MKAGTLCTALLLVVSSSSGEATAQTLSGRVLEEGRNLPVAGAVISLVDRAEKTWAETTSDLLGRFLLAPPQPGEYFVEAKRFGYAATRSPLLSLTPEGSVPLEIMMRPEPIGLRGFEVSVERKAEEFLGIFGHTPSTLGGRWIDRDDIERMPLPTGPGQVIRWRGIAGTSVHGVDGPPGLASLCVSFRRARTGAGGERCAGIWLNGVPISPVEAQALSPDEIEAIAILTPMDATTFYGTAGGGGAVLIWLRSGGG